MTTILVPGDPAPDRADVWIATDEPPPAQARLVHAGGTTPVVGSWERWPATGASWIRHQTVTVTGLPDHGRSAIQLESGGTTLATGHLTTLPRQLPAGADHPLSFLLGSCYCHAKDGVRVDAAYDRLPPSHRPDFKILCGDQIYLDSPWGEFARHTHSREELQASFFDRYWTTWGGQPGKPGLSRLLADGANLFIADDHELWNNAPSRATVVLDTWGAGGRKAWRSVADPLYRIFQTTSLWTTFAVPPLSFAILDTRLERDADERRFVSDANMARLEQWMGALPGPGMLVLGQPVFSKRQGFRGNFFDWGLADYSEHYPRLVRALQRAPHDVVVLTGDVHYRRVASSRVTPSRTLHEVIASPLALVDGKAGGEWKPAPDSFPADDVPGAPRRGVSTLADVNGFDDHFLVLQCRHVAPGVRVEIFDFAVRGAPAPGATRPIASLQLR